MGTLEMKQSLYICVYVPEFPAQSLLRLRPELASSPVAVLEGDPPLEQVYSFNAHAARLGVVAGMTRSQLECFDTLLVLRRSKQEERSARFALLEAAGAFTPRIEVRPSLVSAFLFALDMTGTTRIFGSPSQAINKITKSITSLRFFGQIAASANLHAAACVATSARKASILLPSGQEAKHLSELPLSALNLTPKQADTFSLWGIHTCGDLAELSEVELVVRLGQEGKRLRLLARGEYPHLLVPEEPVFLLEECLSFDAPVELLDSLLFVLSPMLDQLLARAQSRAYALASVTVKLLLDGGGEYVRTIKPALPVAQRDILLKLLHLDLQAHPPSAGILGVFLHAEPGDRSKVQLGLFAPQLPEPLRLDVTLARIAALVGEERVGRPRLQDTHRPDSFTIERFSVPTSSAKERRNARAIVNLRRCRPPATLTVHHEDQRLAAFFLQGKRYAVEKAYGPWRKSGDWWSGSVWSHEEWDVHAVASEDDTLLCLLSHDLLRHHWQLEALYD